MSMCCLDLQWTVCTEDHQTEQEYIMQWSSLQDWFPELPPFVSRRAPTLQDELVHSHLSPKTFRGSCWHGGTMSIMGRFVDLFTNKVYKINHFVNCNTSFPVYSLECPFWLFCGGRTKRRFKDRLGGHKTAITQKIHITHLLQQHRTWEPLFFAGIWPWTHT